MVKFILFKVMMYNIQLKIIYKVPYHQNIFGSFSVFGTKKNTTAEQS